jgi:hypothetical protein
MSKKINLNKKETKDKRKVVLLYLSIYCIKICPEFM